MIMGKKLAPEASTPLFKVCGLTLLFALSLFLTRSAHARDVTLAWDGDATVDGYMVYYKTGTSGPPYNGTGAAEGDSPIDVGWVTEFTLRALSDSEDYYFAVTAYKAGLESWYSNEATTARSVAVSSGSGGGGGGGGGCFLSILSDGK